MYQMRCMVGPYDADPAVGKGLPQCIAVGSRLHRRVAFDPSTFRQIVFVGENEVGNHGFGSDPRICPEKFQFFGRGEMGHV